MIASTKITYTEMLTFIVFLVFNLLSRKVFFKNSEDNRNC